MPACCVPLHWLTFADLHWPCGPLGWSVLGIVQPRLVTNTAVRTVALQISFTANRTDELIWMEDHIHLNSSSTEPDYRF